MIMEAFIHARFSKLIGFSAPAIPVEADLVLVSKVLDTLEKVMIQRGKLENMGIVRIDGEEVEAFKGVREIAYSLNAFIESMIAELFSYFSRLENGIPHDVFIVDNEYKIMLEVMTIHYGNMIPSNQNSYTH